MTVQRSVWWVPLLALITATVFGTGCVTNGRRVLLKEYGPTIPALATQDLKGATICLKGFDCAPNLVSLDLKTRPDEPDQYKYVEFTPEQEQIWTKDMRDLQKRTTKADGQEIGNMRGAFGSVGSHVYALNDLAVWLADSLKLDLEAQGAKVVDASQAATADVCISGTIQLCRADMYFKIAAELVVDIDVQPRQGALRHKQIHTHGETLAVLASEGEYYHGFRACRQKFSILATREMVQAMKP